MSRDQRTTTLRTRGKVIASIVALACVFPAEAVATAPNAAELGSSAQYIYQSATGAVHFRVFTPSGYRPGHPVPLVVFVHGCNTTAEQQENASLYDPVAEAHHFVILYPDDNDVAHLVQCWRFYDPSNWQRGGGDLATIVGMVHATMAMRTIDIDRVYEIGMSSGALLTSDLGAAYPDVFAAIGIMAGAPYGLPTCASGLAGLPSLGDPASEASAAFKAESSRARVMPFIVLNGDADPVVSPGCDDQAVQQWLRTDNLVLSGGQTAPLSLNASTTTAKPPAVAGGRPYNVLSYTAPNGCLIGEHHVIHGMGHYWSGGTTDPTYAQFTDPNGPSAAQASWNFFSHFTLARPATDCTPTRTHRQHRKRRRHHRHRRSHAVHSAAAGAR